VAHEVSLQVRICVVFAIVVAVLVCGLVRGEALEPVVEVLDQA
jgi:hypothetical protein